MKRTRSTSAESAVKAMVDASKAPIEPPAHVILRAGDHVFWKGVVRSRARDEWSESDLVVAAQLARCQADIEAEQALLHAEGSLTLNDRGTRVVNPRGAVLDLLTRREMAMLRTLRMAGRVAGDTRNEAGRRKIERQSAKLAEELHDDDLLAH